MKENVGRVDRLVRTVIGPGLVVLGYTRLGGRRGTLAGLAAMMAGVGIIDSAITRVCPMNALFGIDTRTAAERERDLLESQLAEPRAPTITIPIGVG